MKIHFVEKCISVCILLVLSGVTLMAQKHSREFVFTAEQLIPVGEKPEKTVLKDGDKTLSGWILSSKAEGELLGGRVEQLSPECTGIRVEITVFTAEGSAGTTDVYTMELSQQKNGTEQIVNRIREKPIVATVVPGMRTVQLTSYYDVNPSLMLNVKVGRLPAHPSDNFAVDVILTRVRVIELLPIEKNVIVQDVLGYNSWPMIQAMGKKLVCIYSRGLRHTIADGERNVYASISEDCGKSWSPEVLVTGRPEYGEVAVGKGLDDTGAALFWVRCWGRQGRHHELFRTTDGVEFTRLASTVLSPEPMQITDIFNVPGVGMMSLWFNTNYRDLSVNAWGTLVSKDQGKTWEQRTIESGKVIPEEPSALYLGNGRILAVGRASTQFQLESYDYGKTWTRMKTNITDVAESTPTLILNPKTGIISNYYYYRGRGVLNRRTARADSILGNPLSWSYPDAVAEGSKFSCDAGNANATVIDSLHVVSFYTGKTPDTSVVVSRIIGE